MTRALSSAKSDLSAFEVLVTRYQKKMLNLLPTGRDYDDACEVVQTQLFPRLQNIKTFRGDAKFIQLTTITLNLSKNRLKQMRNPAIVKLFPE
jgi:DNA-directed RNA polymerase specialized sigma24 family protein